jgi:hypothetical protein
MAAMIGTLARLALEHLPINHSLDRFGHDVFRPALFNA